MQKALIKSLLLALLSWTSSAFVVAPAATRASITVVKGANSDDNTNTPSGIISPQLKAAAFTTLVTLSQHPLVALAEDADDYEYGAVSAPPFVPIIGGLLAILTALLPIALRGGEEAFEEMKESDSFGKGKDVLKSRRK